MENDIMYKYSVQLSRDLFGSSFVVFLTKLRRYKCIVI